MGLQLLEDQAESARALLAPEVLSYYDAGAGDEVTRVESEPAWAGFRLRPRVLRDVETVSTATTAAGVALAHPVGVAPMAFHALADRDGEVATAQGAGRSGALLVLSTRSSRSLEDVAAAASGPWWFQVYVMKDRRLTESLVRRAAAAGAGALVLTGDTPYVGLKRRVSGTRLAVPDDHFLVNLAAHAVPGQSITAQRAAAEQDPAVDLSTIRWLAEVSGLPVLVKGVLRGDDAVACLEAGASGVVVSNHGGRQLDRALPSALALAEVAGAVAGRGAVLVDGGLRSGTDVLVALALGADAVLLGRPVLWALASGGADGVAACVGAVRSHLEHVMALAGACRLDQLGPDLVVAPRAPG
ncbi:alpha-hydroxy acid oxidase [Quadrisphaera sp. DSM 44207]|uniref:alpha-hydroxy acid oxidase n=1 Tax=Quadrisphaera sp. DSM 44207 TaxID=1881057 RepID=UPI00088537C5|nr:alpha-hydroxy acid oxidase [Quadrisphaera sp. DSM 44207]SDQ68612.1 4-hydroxymandelate oxidase [Quadrisphaera sp. DSM 44207]